MSPPPLCTEGMACVGVALTDFTVAVAASGGGHTRPISIANDQVCFPPSVILGELAGEPTTVDFCGPPSLRGSGLAWPPSARIDPAAGTARFPISLAWPLLDYKTHSSWTWRVSGERTVLCEPAEAIASVLQAGLARANGASAAQALSIVVPNTIDVEAQDRLLRAMSLRHTNAQLLWRPIAAALAWITEHGAAVLNTGSARKRTAYTPLGLIWVVHLGLDGFEATQLELIPWEHRGLELLLPARRLPVLPTLYGAGLEWVEWLSEQAQEASGDPAGAAWNLMWTTNWFEQIIRRSCRHTDNAASACPHLMLHDADVIDRGVVNIRTLLDAFTRTRGQLSTYTSSATRIRRNFAPLDGPFSQEKLGRSVVTTSLGKWVDELRKLARTDLPVLGIVGTGAFAGLSYGDATFCELIVRLVGNTERIPRACIDSTSTILSCGAAIYSERCKSEIPAYLDVLPKLELLIVRSGEPVFEDILRVEAPYVLGGQERVYEPTDLGLHVRREERSLTLPVWREGHDFVRDVDVEFPNQILRDTPVQLQVRITPGQGNPRIEVKPEIAHLFGGRRVYLDWARAHDTGQTKEEELARVPRTNPPLEPRLASLDAWRGGWWQSTSARAEVVRFLSDLPRLSGPRFAERIDGLIKVVRDKDPVFARQRIPEHATAVSSDGCIHPLGADAGQFDQFVQALDGCLGSSKFSDYEDKIVRTLGYCSASTPRLRRLLTSIIGHPSRIESHHLVGVGNCLRDPDECSLLAEAMLANLRSTKPKAPNDWMRAMCRILQYRDKAASVTASQTCAALSECCLRYLRQQVSEGKAKFLYRHASLCIVYLLRRRRWDDGYLDPGSPLAKQIKSTFREAITRFQSDRLVAIEGFVNLPHVTQMMIDYIDRKGKGRLVGFAVGE